MTDNIAFVQSLYAAFGRGDLSFILGNLHPGIEWSSNANPAIVPWGGTRTGTEGATAFFVALGGNLDFEIFEPKEFHAAGGTVTVVGHTRARCKNGGHGLFDSEWVHIFTVTDGKLMRFREYYDTAAIEAALAV